MPFGFDQAIDSISDGLGDLASAFGFNITGKSNKDGDLYGYAESYIEELSSKNGQAWTFKGSDWYKIFGYQFVVQVLDEDGNSIDELIYTLPIPPQSISIRMIPASQATATFGGVVEETSENVFWLMNLVGTTGIAVSRQETGSKKRFKMAKQFRDSISTTGLLSGALAGVNAAISKIGGAADALIDMGKAVADGDVAGATGGLVGAFNTAFLPALPYAASSVDQDTNGYTEIQELHRFLYTYSKLKSKQPKTFQLKFRCYKTNQEWTCILQDFNIQQSAQNPMLYRYNIALKGWGVTEPAKGDDSAAFDRFAPGGDLQPVNLVNPQLFGTIKDNILKKI